MTDIDFSHRATLNLLRVLRAGVTGPSLLTGPGLMEELRARGLVIQHQGGWTTSSEADRLLDQIDAIGAQMLADFEPCSFTHSHTRHWCGRDTCRDS